MLALERNVDFTVVKCVIIASPGFVKVGISVTHIFIHHRTNSSNT